MKATIRAAALAVLVGMAGAACTTARAAAPVERPALDVPPPPPRVIVPLPTPQNQIEPLPEVGSIEPMTPKPRATREKEPPKAEPKPEDPKAAEPPAPAPPAQQPPPQLRLPESSDRPQASQIQRTIDQSRQILGAVKTENLSASAQQAHKEALMFATQAEGHLKTNNLPLAKELADKAAIIAKALQR